MKPNAAEFEISRLIGMGIPAEAAGMFVRLNDDSRFKKQARTFKARVEYARRRTVTKLVDGIPCNGWHDECRARSPLSAGCWTGD